MNTASRTYIGREEAFEIALELGFDRLPRIGRQYIQNRPTLELQLGMTNIVLGKDEQGYYTA